MTNYELGRFERDYWRVVKQAKYKLPDLVIYAQASGCIKVKYEITAEGKFANPTIEKQVNGDIFKEPLLASLYKWRWAPTKTNEVDKIPIITSRFFSIGTDKKVTQQCL